MLDDNQSVKSEVEDMDQDDFDDDSNTNDADEWAQDPFLDEVKSEQDDEDDIPESDPLQGVGEPSKTKTKTKERSNAFKCHICKRKRTYQTEPGIDWTSRGSHFLIFTRFQIIIYLSCFFFQRYFLTLAKFMRGKFGFGRPNIRVLSAKGTNSQPTIPTNGGLTSLRARSIVT